MKHNITDKTNILKKPNIDGNKAEIPFANTKLFGKV